MKELRGFESLTLNSWVFFSNYMNLSTKDSSRALPHRIFTVVDKVRDTKMMMNTVRNSIYYLSYVS